MPFELIWEPKGLVRRYFGRLNASELLLPILASHVDPRFDSVRYVIDDCMNVTEVQMTARELSNVVGEISIHDNGASCSNGRIRFAIVATHPTLLEVARAYLASPIRVFPTRVFSCLTPARRWVGASLGLDPGLADHPSPEREL